MDRRRRRRLAQMRITIGVILAIALVIGALLVGFHIRSAEVAGNIRHSAEEIRADLIHDFATNNSLYLSWKYRTAGEEPRMPYLSSVQVKLSGPGKVLIQVAEKEIAGGIIYGGSNVYFDETGMVLEISDSRYDQIPLITGVTMEEPVLYQKLPVTNAALLSTMMKISGLIRESGLIADGISFDENLNISVKAGDIEIELGQDEYLSEKISNLMTIYPKIAGQSGILKLSAYTGKSDDIQFEETGGKVEETETEEPGEDYEVDQDTGDWDESGNAEGEYAEDAAFQEQNGEDEYTQEEEGPAAGEVTGVAGFQVFDSSGTLRNDARVIGGRVVDAYGNDIPGCSLNDDGYVVDAYWNVINPMTGWPD